MKHLRTIITILLVLAMVLSSVGVFAAEETVSSSRTFSDITPGTKVADAVTKLVGYGVINGYEDGTFKPDNTITRAEFAAVITRFKGIGNNLAADAVTGFADLDGDASRAWARPYVKAAVDAGIINGFEDGTFRAAEPVTYEQAVKMIVCAINYEPIAISEYNRLLALDATNVTWSSGYIATAQKNSITLNAVTANITEPATRGTVAILTSNAYEVPELEAITDDNGNTSYAQGGGSVGGGQYNSQEKIQGTVIANYYTSLEDSDSKLEENEIKIRESGEENIYELSSDLMNSVDVMDLLGKRVVAYYANDVYALVSIEARNDEITEIEESQVVRPIRNGKITYEDENNDRETINVNDYTIIYNGKSDYIEYIDEIDEIFNNGYIEVNATTEVVKVTSYDVFVVNRYSKNDGNGKIYFKYNKEYNGNDYYEFPAGSTSFKPDIYVNGTEKSFDSLSLSAYNVVNYLESPDVDGPKLRKMYVTTGAKSGKVTSVIEDDRLVELNNQEYYLTNDYYNYLPNDGDDKKATFEMGDNYSYYLDYTGQIAAINYSSSSQGTYEYGYVLGADESQINLVRKTGTQILNLKSKVKFDGVSISADKVEDKLIAVAREELSDSEKQESYYQPIKFSLSGGEVSVIDTVATDEAGSNDTFKYDELYAGERVKPGTSSVTVNGTLYSFTSSTVVLYVPENRAAEGQYEVMTPSKAFNVTANREIEIFDSDTSGRVNTAGLVLVYGSKNPAYTFTGSSPYIVVTKVNTSTRTIEGYKSGDTETSKVKVSEDRFFTEDEEDEKLALVSLNRVEEGDLIRVLENSGEVIAIEMIYDASEGEDSLNTNSGYVDDDGLEFATVGSNKLYVYYAEAFQKYVNENKIMVTTEFGGTDEDKLANTETVSVNSSTVYYSFDGDDIISGDSLDSIDAESGNSDKVIYIRQGSTTSAAKIFYILD